VKQSNIEVTNPNVSNAFDLSIGQKELWFIHSMGGLAQTAYNEPLIYTLNGYIQLKALRQAFAALIDKHEALRTSFKQDSQGNVFQYIEDAVAMDFTVLEPEDENEIDDLIHIFIRKPFNLEKPPLMRVSLLKKKQDQYVLVIVMHHIITDGTSFGILVNDLNTFYNQLMHGEAIDGHGSGKK